MKHLAQRIVLGLVIAAQAIFGGLPASAQLFVPPPEKTPAILDGSTVVAATNSERVATTGVATPVVTPQVSPSDSRPDPIRGRSPIQRQGAPARMQRLPPPTAMATATMQMAT